MPTHLVAAPEWVPHEVDEGAEAADARMVAVLLAGPEVVEFGPHLHGSHPCHALDQRPAAR